MLIRDINGEFAGVCRYCGQIVTFIDKPKEDIDADEAATRRCGCPEAVAYRMELDEIEARKNAYRDAMAAVNELFSEGEKPINSEAQLALHQLVKLICDGWVDKADVAADGITAKLQITSKGNVKITRKEKKERSREVRV